MSEKELVKLIEKGETEKVEFKESFNKDTVEAAAAFANLNGGVILIGVGDDGKIRGVSLGKETLKTWANEIIQATEPILIPEIESCQIKGKKIIAITIKESPIKPIASKGICYLRMKNSNKKLTPKEIAELHLQTIGSSWDSYAAKNASLDDIDLEKVKEYIKLANETGRRKIAEKPIEVLKKMELIKGNKPTWAAILLFGKKPQRFVLQSKVHCGRFKDEITIINDEAAGETLFEQVEKAMEFVKKSISVKFVITGKPRREEIWEYPLDAIREAVINAIAHRDYTELSKIQIRIYDDKLIVWSPGKLPLGITLNDLFKPHKSVLRNKLIAQVFYDVGLIEQWGTGIKRMADSCLKRGLPEPKFEEQQGFKVTFRKDIFTDDYLKNSGLNERQIKAVVFMKKEGKITNKIYRDLTDLSDEGVRKDLIFLLEKGLIKIVGKGRGTYYVLK